MNDTNIILLTVQANIACNPASENLSCWNIRSDCAQATPDIHYFQQSFNALVENIAIAVAGKTTPIKQCVTALLAGGHVLLEDNPGTGKTQLHGLWPIPSTPASSASNSRQICCLRT